MLYAQKLWINNLDLASKSLNTKFVQGIKDGSLPKKKFQAYVAQDYFFLKSFSKAYEMAIEKCEEHKTQRILKELLNGVSEEISLHKSYSQKWGIDLTNNEIIMATKNYTDFLKQVSTEYNFILIIC